MTFQVVVTNAVWRCVTMTAGEVMGLPGNGTDLCFAKGVRLSGSFFETAYTIFFGYPFVVTARTGMQAEGSLHRKQLCLLDRQLSVFSMGGKTGDMAGAKTVCCLSVTLGILSENIVQQLEKAISDIAGIAGRPFTDAVINQYHNF